MKEKIWIFGYGSLLWDKESDTENLTPATLKDWHREYNQLSSVNRGTRDNKGVVLGLIKGGNCDGFLFQILESDFDDFKQREGINSGNYLLLNSKKDDLVIFINDSKFDQEFYVVVSNLKSSAYIGDWTLKKRAKRALESSKPGKRENMRSTSIKYIIKNYLEYQKKGIEDKALKSMYEIIKTMLKK